MHYLEPLLAAQEELLFDGKIHPIVFARGVIYFGIALFILIELADLPLKGGALMYSGYYLQQATGFDMLYSVLWNLHHTLREYPTVVSFIGLGVLLLAIRALVRAVISYFFVEIVVTNQRLLVKKGVWNVFTSEIDTNRIAGVDVYQSFYGRMFNYGWVLVHGFMQNIGGLPPIWKPHDLQTKLKGRLAEKGRGL